MSGQEITESWEESILFNKSATYFQERRNIYKTPFFEQEINKEKSIKMTFNYTYICLVLGDAPFPWAPTSTR